LLGIFCSGSRGGYISAIVATAAFAMLWVVRVARFDRRSLAPAIISTAALIAFAILIGLIVFWPRLHNVVLGGGREAYSNQGRQEQWELAKPKIAANPITGHGFGIGAEVIGFYNAGSPIPTVDSYVLSTLVETGIPGFLFFFGMIGVAVWTGASRYLGDPSRQSAVAGAVTCAILAFGVYRLVLSQRECHTLFYLLIGAMMLLNHFALADKREQPHEMSV
jgi:O-antigen ligase